MKIIIKKAIMINTRSALKLDCFFRHSGKTQNDLFCEFSLPSNDTTINTVLMFFFIFI